MDAQRDRTPVRAAPTYGTIVVAAQPLTFGDEIARGALREIPWPSDNVIQGSFKTIDQVLDGKTRRVALASMTANEPLLERKITGPGQRGNLAAVIEAGHKAIALRVDEVVGVAGFLQPGDRVDVLLSRRDGRGDASSNVVLQNLKVLGVDQTVEEHGAKPIIAKSVTLEVATEDAQRLVVAQSIGALTLVLRPIGSSDVQPNRTVSGADLLDGPRPAAEPPPPSAPRATVGVVRKLARETYSVPATGAH